MTSKFSLVRGRGTRRGPAGPENGRRDPRRANSRGPGGFTLVEVLVVVAIIVILIAILLPVLGRVRGNARTTVCLTNHRTLATAATQYALDNNQRLASPRTDKISGVTSPWVNASGSNLQTLPGGLKVETLAALETGALWDYADRNVSAYKSPLDPTDRLRSYSMNAYVGNVNCPDDFGCGTLVPLPSGQNSLSTNSLTKIPQPSRTLAFINEESPLGYNEEGWVIDWSVPYWEDTPAIWDGTRINVSFMDGSTKTLDIFGQTFLQQVAASPTGFTESGSLASGAEDGPAAWLAMRQFLLPGRLDF
jgi:prepilin-type N-terminal cleavage/methylation domain-containing protein